MLALFGNLSMLEIVGIVVVAILVFGKNLPVVASDAARKLGRLRRTLEDLRRDSGIDAEVREVKRSLQQGMDGPIRPRQLAGTVAKRALGAAGLGQDELDQVSENHPRKTLDTLKEEVAQAGEEPVPDEET